MPYPVVVIYRGATLYGWVMGDEAGHYAADLPDESGASAVHLQVEKSGTTPGAASADFTAATVPPAPWTSRRGPISFL